MSDIDYLALQANIICVSISLGTASILARPEWFR